MAEKPSNVGSCSDHVIANVALLYYKEGLNQADIAQRTGLSRATVVKYLKISRDRGIVEFMVRGNSLAASPESRKLCAKFGLFDAYVADTGPSPDSGLALRHTARVAAAAFHDIVGRGDAIGIAWGETMNKVAENLPRRTVPDTQVCQVIGAMDSPRLLTAEDCTIQFAGKIGAECRTLHAPAVLSSSDLAKSLRNEPAIRAQLDQLKSLDAIFTSVGNLDPAGHLVAAGIISAEEVVHVAEKGGVCFICSRFVSSRGRLIEHPIYERMIAIGFREFKRIPKRVLVASGNHKIEAVRAAIGNRLVNYAILDRHLASSLLDFEGSS